MSLRSVCSSFGRAIRPRNPIPILSQEMSQSTSDSTIDHLDPLPIQHDKNKSKFFIKFDNVSEEAVLEYSVVRPRVLELYHTGVPIELRGKGVAERLAQEAFDYAVEKDYDIILTCTYLQKYLQKNPKPEYARKVITS